MHGAGDFVFFFPFLCVYGKHKKKKKSRVSYKGMEKKTKSPQPIHFLCPSLVRARKRDSPDRRQNWD
jgi:hypothetical protein